MFTQFRINRELKIIRFDGDPLISEHHGKNLENIIVECEDLYPGIDVWFKKKVKPGLKSKDRVAFLLYHDEYPIGAAVLRKGENSKLCSMRILSDEQNKGVGSLLISLIAKEVRGASKKIHFTIPSQIWFKWEKYFEKYGFKNDGPADIQYRLFDQELTCSANFHDLWKTVIQKLPQIIQSLTLNGNKAHCDIVLSVRPEYAERIITGKKKIEIRRKFSSKWKGASALIYASSPRKEFVGEAEIGEIISGTPEKIWSNWHDEIGCSYEEFTLYCEGAKNVTGLIFSDVRPFKLPILKSQLQYLIQKDLKAPQSYCEVKKDPIWPTALSLSCLLQSSL